MRLLLPALAVWSGLAYASVVKVDDPALALLGASQDGFNITRDLKNGLDWLDWTLTSGYSFDAAQALLAPGKALEGWRFATASDFVALGKSAALPATHRDRFVSGAAPDALVELALALGITRHSDLSAFALFDEPGERGYGLVRLGGITLARPDTSVAARSGRTDSATTAIVDVPNAPEIWLSQSWHRHLFHSTLGAALVRPTVATIPEPATLALMCVALSGLLAAALRRRPARAEATT